MGAESVTRPMMSLVGNWGRRLGVEKESSLNSNDLYGLKANVPRLTPASLRKSRREILCFILSFTTKIYSSFFSLRPFGVSQLARERAAAQYASQGYLQTNG